MSLLEVAGGVIVNACELAFKGGFGFKGNRTGFFNGCKQVPWSTAWCHVDTREKS